jgi:hypothetical protein
VIFDPPRQGQQNDPFAIPMMDLPCEEIDAELLDENERSIQFTEVLSTLSPNQRIWWDRLLAKHKASIASDDDLSLLLSFREFIRRIDTLGLSFDNAQLTHSSFYDVTDMRTAMANMLTILTHVSSRGLHARYNDVQTQWAYIANVSLASNGAIRAVYQQPPYGIILPQMMIDSNHYAQDSAQNKYSFLGYCANKTKLDDNLDALSDEEFEEHFFRSIAVQQHRYSMAFYLEATQTIRQFILFDYNPTRQRHAQRILFQLLLTSTTGSAHFCNLSEEVALSQWRSIVSLFQDFPMPTRGIAGVASSVTRFFGFAAGYDMKKELSSEIMDTFYKLNISSIYRGLYLD